MNTNTTTKRGINPATARRQRRLVAFVTGVTLLGIATTLVLVAFEDSLVFFYSPSELSEQRIGSGQRFRLGGLVVEGSVRKGEDGITNLFAITDLASTVNVSFRGQLPDLFREGQGVVTEGNLSDAGLFTANEVLAKHDETYMPAEVADALKAAGQWRDPVAGGEGT